MSSSSWQLGIYSPTGVFERGFINQVVPNAVMGLPTAILNANGRVEQLVVDVSNDIALIAPRSLLQYRVDVADQPNVVAWGVAVTCPPVTSPGSGPDDTDASSLDRVTAVGLEALLDDCVVGARIWDRARMIALGSNDAAIIAYDLARLYAHPRIVVDAGNFPPTGSTVGLFYAPTITVAEALDKLAGMVAGGARWWVDHLRRLRFEALS